MQTHTTNSNNSLPIKSERNSEGFRYVVERPKKAQICFGSGLERSPIEKSLTSRHAIQNYKFTKTDVEFRSFDTNKKLLGSAWAKPKEKPQPESTPGPGHYNLSEWKIPYRMQYTTKRKIFKRKLFETPGPGYYKYSVPLCRHIPFSETFGGRRFLIPAIKLKCGPLNSDLCELCNNKPCGDYWRNVNYKWSENKSDVKEISLCRTCYSSELLNPIYIKKSQLKNFYKERDCTEFHDHEGCEAKRHLIPPRAVRLLQIKETYLSLYYQ